jgi:hypothetical protein
MLRNISKFLSILALSTISVQAAIVSGVVKAGDSTGVAVDSAIVTLTIGTGGGAQTLRDTTDATGAYRISSTLLRIGTDQIRAAKTGFNTMTQSAIIIADSTATYTRNLYLVPFVYGSIIGTVLDSAAGTAIAGAKVYLRSTGGGGTILDSTVTTFDGSYKIANVQSGIARSLSALATGFFTKTSTVTVVGSAALTVNIPLVKIIYGSIIGTVLDSAAGTAITGAKVYLRSTGGGGTILDSTVTAFDGSYKIANVQTGIARTLNVQASGFIAKNTAVTVIDTAAMTVNIKLVKILSGSITGTVTDSVAATPIVGAKVYLRTTGGGGGTLLDSAITVANGSYTIMNVQTGIARTLNAQASSFIAKNTAVTVPDTTAMTVNIKLVKILFGSITGTVTDSVAATPIAGAKVYLRTTGGGGTILDSAITAANGSYTIANVQSGVARTLRVQDSGYVTKNTTVTVVGTAALTVNVQLIKSQVSISSANARGLPANPDFGVARSGLLRLNNFSDAGMVKVFNSNGKLLYHCAISDHTTFLTLPKSIAKPGNALIVSVTQNNATYRKQIMMP